MEAAGGPSTYRSTRGEAMTTSRRTRPRVVVISDQSLVTESVLAALEERGLEPGALRWPGELAPGPIRPVRGPPYEAGLMISDLDRPDRLRTAVAVLASIPTSWIVLTAAERGPVWGAVLKAGARSVVPTSASLDSVVSTLRIVAHGDEPLPSPERDDLVMAWDDLRRDHAIVRARARSLTPREREVLRLLYGGESVHEIAVLLEITPATVRSQVKSVLRKLEVNSQLAAVAAMGHLIEFDGFELS